MKRKTIFSITVMFLIIAFLPGCLGPGLITDVSPSGGDEPGPTPSPTPTSWYIQNVFEGRWSYQFYSGQMPVQLYEVTHSVFNNGEITMKFIDGQSGNIMFRANGTIDMKTGYFQASGELAKIDDVDGDIEFNGTFATDTINDYVAYQEDFFSTTNTESYNYEIRTIRYNQ